MRVIPAFLSLSNTCTTQSWKAQVDQYKFAAGRKSLFRCSLEEILVGRLIIRSRALQHFLQLRRL